MGCKVDGKGMHVTDTDGIGAEKGWHDGEMSAEADKGRRGVAVTDGMGLNVLLGWASSSRAGANVQAKEDGRDRANLHPPCFRCKCTGTSHTRAIRTKNWDVSIDGDAVKFMEIFRDFLADSYLSNVQ